MTIDPGAIVARRYRVTGQLGRGGMGEVFAAENTRTGRHVALKVLRAEAKTKSSAIERFRREARAAGSINSDYVTQVLDVEDDPEHGIVLVFELLEGESLVERLKRTGPIDFPELWGIVEAVWMGLMDAHDVGIVHRDLKPSNVFLEARKSGNTRVKILDFGISKLPKQLSSQSLTQAGQSLGTFSFMPPEQIGRAKNVDHRADIYSCTTLIFQALSGRLPYQAKNVVAMMELKNKTEPRTLSDVMPGPIDPELEAFIAKGLARDLNVRFQTAAEALEAWRTLRPAGARSVAEAEPSSSYGGSMAPESEEFGPSSASLPTVKVRKSDLDARLAEMGLSGAAGNVGASPSGAGASPSSVTPLPANVAGASLGASRSGVGASPSGAAVPPSSVAGQDALPTVPMPPKEAEALLGKLAARDGDDIEANIETTLKKRPEAIDEHVVASVRGGRPKAPRKRRGGGLLTTVLGALALMVLGFVVVAAALHFMGAN